MKTYEICTWPAANDLTIQTDKVDIATGRILRTRKTNRKRSKAWWEAHGFSFNGKLRAGTH